MKQFFGTFIIVYIVWVFLVQPFGFVEMVVGLVVSVFVTLVTWKFFSTERHKMIFNPKNWIRMVKYMLVFVWLEIKSHLEVTRLIITGNIKPAIIAIPTQFETDLGKTLLSNSITLTPGTLTMDASDMIYVHAINYKKDHDIGFHFEKHGKHMTESIKPPEKKKMKKSGKPHKKEKIKNKRGIRK